MWDGGVAGEKAKDEAKGDENDDEVEGEEKGEEKKHNSENTDDEGRCNPRGLKRTRCRVLRAIIISRTCSPGWCQSRLTAAIPVDSPY